MKASSLPNGNERREYDRGTYVDVRYPWGLFVGGRVYCGDGKVRKLKRIAQTADTFFSVPASVNVGKITVSGYITFCEVIDKTSWKTVETFPVFQPVRNRKNAAALPDIKTTLYIVDGKPVE